MSEQTNITEIPVNTRTIGTPGGVYVLYLEDYVHTFIKKLLSETAGKTVQYKTVDGIMLYGNRIDEQGTSLLIVSGAVSTDFMADKADKIFQGCIFLGTAKISLNRAEGLRIEISINREINVILEDFYIYYDQNEQMQNYLIDWNLKHQTSLYKNISEDYSRMGIEDDIERIESYNIKQHRHSNEEPKVSFMWNAVNVLSLGFVICVIVYGIVSVNNYEKMHSMEEAIDYCVEVISNNVLKKDKTIENVQSEESVEQNSEINIEALMESNTSPEGSNEISADESIVSNDDIAEGITEDQNVIQNTGSDASETEPQADIPQYYIVRRGDTLRTICYDVYGDYSKVAEVCRWNNIDNPDSILYGQKLLLP